MQVNFTIIGKIETKGRPRFFTKGKYPIVYTPANTKKYEELVRKEYNNMYNFGERPLYAKIRAYFSIASSISQKKRNQMVLEPCIKNKDLDNIAKIILDSLNGVAYNDDKQITELEITKNWSIGEEHIEVEIGDIENEEDSDTNC